MEPLSIAACVVAAGAALAPWARARILLSRAKHPSLAGHARLAARVARLIRFYEYPDETYFQVDGAPDEIAARRRSGFERLARTFDDRAGTTVAGTSLLAAGLSDLQFTNAHRVPFAFRRRVMSHLRLGGLVVRARDMRLQDLDGNIAYDLTGSYGVNVFGYDFYRECIDAGAARVRELGPVLGMLHPVVVENVERLRAISGLDEVSFHMSGTEAVMQAVRLARYHTRRSHVVQFCGAYHGWWDGVQPGVGNPRRVRDVYVLRDMAEETLRVLETRRDIACVLVNPLQALHPNTAAPGDTTLVAGDRRAQLDRDGYARWLDRLRDVCARRGIVLIFDEVFVGFRIALGGAQEYFGVQPDMVTYGKTIGGGLPVGVLCGRRHLMARFRPDRPADICFARGTFNGHPYVMGAMNEFLRRLDRPELRDSYRDLDRRWTGRAVALNGRLEREGLPVRVANITSIWTVCYLAPSRYNWMFQFYLRAEGLALSWVGTGRLIFTNACTDGDFEAVADRFVSAAAAMRDDGWWWTGESASNRGIRRQLFQEMVAAALSPRTAITPDGGVHQARPALHAAAEAARGGTASRRGTDR